MIWSPKRFHIELSSACVAKCPFCPRTKELGSFPVQELRLKDITSFFTAEILKHTESIALCWSYGDPIYARDFLEIVHYFHKHGVFTSVSTNGYNSQENFWSKLPTSNFQIIFGIDGITQTTHSKYRTWTNLKTILKNAKEFCDIWGYAIWQILLFQHNEHQIETARKISKRLGFRDFIVRKSRQYDKKLLEPLSSTTYTRMDHLIKWKAVCEYEKNESWYISASGQVLPCCYLWNIEFSNKSLLHEKMNIKNSSYEEIKNLAYWKNQIGNFITQKGINKCLSRCWVTR